MEVWSLWKTRFGDLAHSSTKSASCGGFSGCPLWNSEPQRPRLGLRILGQQAGRRPLVVGILWVVGREGNMEESFSPDLHSIPHSQCAAATRLWGLECMGNWERGGLAVDAGKRKQPDGEPGSGRGGSARNPEKTECEEPRSPLPQGLLVQLPWGTFVTPASKTEGFFIPGKGHTQKETFPSSCVPELPFSPAPSSLLRLHPMVEQPLPQAQELELSTPARRKSASCQGPSEPQAA